MQEFWLGSLRIHSLDQTQFQLHSPIEGLESPEYRIGSYEKPGEDGGEVSSALYGVRPVTLVGRVAGSTDAQFEVNRLQLSAACAISRDANGYPSLIRCQLTTLSGQTYFFDAQVGKPVFKYENLQWSSFMIPLTVPDPQIYATGTITSGSVSLPTSNGTTWPVTWPLTWGGLTGGAAMVANSGTLFTWPIITLTGPLTNPYILNATTGKLMQLSYTLAAGATAKIYMADKRIMLNDTDSLIATKTSDSEWWALEPGENIISFSSGSSADTGIMQLSFNAAYVGI